MRQSFIAAGKALLRAKHCCGAKAWRCCEVGRLRGAKFFSRAKRCRGANAAAGQIAFAWHRRKALLRVRGSAAGQGVAAGQSVAAVQRCAVGQSFAAGQGLAADRALLRDTVLLRGSAVLLCKALLRGKAQLQGKAGTCCGGSALRVLPAETRLTVYRRLRVRLRGPASWNSKKC